MASADWESLFVVVLCFAHVNQPRRRINNLLISPAKRFVEYVCFARDPAVCQEHTAKCMAMVIPSSFYNGIALASPKAKREKKYAYPSFLCAIAVAALVTVLVSSAVPSMRY